MSTPVIVWFRRDLRLSDNPTLHAALATGGVVVPVFVWDEPADPQPGSAGHGVSSLAWQSHSLRALDESLRERGSRLVLRQGDTADQLARLCDEVDAAVVLCTSACTPSGRAEETRVHDALARVGRRLQPVPTAGLALPCGSVHNSQGEPYRVFTPYHRAWRTMFSRAQPLPAPKALATGAVVLPGSDDWPMSPAEAPDITAHWEPGEVGAGRRLARFKMRADTYEELHDMVGFEGTSLLSPHLAFGEVTPRQIVWEVGRDHEAFVRQLAWREFAYTTLNAFPDLASRPLRPEFERMPWIDDEVAVHAWKSGRTGVPIVDAGMRQLAATGWMHNRARMIVASWLTKDALVDWRLGEQHFANLLADAEPALNAFNWQWVAGSGADAAPYFRIFNPVVQAGRFDADGSYVKRWVPELENLEVPWVHRPWDASEAELRKAGVHLGTQYPLASLDHALARNRALDAYHAIKR